MAKADTIDEELVLGLKAAKAKRCSFVLVVKGASDGALIISKQKIPPAAIADAKKKCGGSAVIKGAVFYEDGKFVFETGKPPAATLPNALKLIAKRDAGMAIIAVCRVGTNPDLLDDERGDKPAATPAVVKPATTPAAGAAAAKPGEPAADGEAAYQTRVAALTGDLKKAIVSNTAAGNEAKMRFSESQVFFRKKDLTQAMALLGVVEIEIKKALVGTAKSSEPRAENTADDDSKVEAAYQARVKSLTDDLKKAIITNTSAGNEAKSRFKESQLHFGKKQFVLALDLLDQAEAQIKLALAGTGSDGVSAEALRAFQARWKPIREEWQEAIDTVDGQLSQLQQKLLQTDNDQLHEIAQFGLNALTGNFKVPLLAAMHGLETAAPENLKARAAKLQAVAKAFQTHLASEKNKMKACDGNPFGVKVTIRNLLLPALAEVEKMLATAGES